MQRLILLGVIPILLLQGCTTSPKEFGVAENPKVLRERLYQLENFQVTGKLGFRNPEEAFSVAVNNWTQQADHYQLDLSSTFFGLGAVRISGTPSWITLEEAGEQPIHSQYPSETLEQLLNMPLPIQRIRYWVRGIPAPQSKGIEQINQKGLVESIMQDGWHIQLDRYQDINGLPLPGRIKIIRDKTRITLAIASWSIH